MVANVEQDGHTPIPLKGTALRAIDQTLALSIKRTNPRHLTRVTMLRYFGQDISDQRANSISSESSSLPSTGQSPGLNNREEASGFLAINDGLER
jgi:hypothetical protein